MTLSSLYKLETGKFVVLNRINLKILELNWSVGEKMGSICTAFFQIDFFLFTFNECQRTVGWISLCETKFIWIQKKNIWTKIYILFSIILKLIRYMYAVRCSWVCFSRASYFLYCPNLKVVSIQYLTENEQNLKLKRWCDYIKSNFLLPKTKRNVPFVLPWIDSIPWLMILLHF